MKHKTHYWGGTTSTITALRHINCKSSGRKYTFPRYWTNSILSFKSRLSERRSFFPSTRPWTYHILSFKSSLAEGMSFPVQGHEHIISYLSSPLWQKVCLSQYKTIKISHLIFLTNCDHKSLVKTYLKIWDIFNCNVFYLIFFSKFEMNNYENLQLQKLNLEIWVKKKKDKRQFQYY